LDVGGAEGRDGVDLRTRDSWGFEVEHGLQDRVQLRYCGRHIEGFLPTSIARILV